MSATVAGANSPRGLRHLYEAESLGQLRQRLCDSLAEMEFWGVGESSVPSKARASLYNDSLYEWDNYQSRLGARRDDYLAAKHHACLAQGLEKETRRIEWLSVQMRPYFWIRDAGHHFAIEHERFRVVEDFGLRAADGLVLPLSPCSNGTPRIWAVAETENALSQADDVLGLLAVYYHMSRLLATRDRRGLRVDHGSDRPVELTEKEREVLRWAAAGKTVRDIAVITGMSYRTVRHHIDAARKRYGFATTQQTIVRAAHEYGFDPMGDR